MVSGPLVLMTLLAICIFQSAAHVEARLAALGNVLAFNGPQSIQTTTHTTDSNGNRVIQVCTVQLTPTTVNGEDSVIAVSTCVQTPDSGGGGAGTATTSTGSTVTTTSSSMSTSTTSAPLGGLISSSMTSTMPTTTPLPATATDGGAMSHGTSLVPASLFPSSTSADTVKPTATSSTTIPTGTEAAASAAGAINTSLPGKSISVLPIGLGVFAGLSVIAIIVVGAVTYERTKYRKNFRAQKLAEAGGTMGYGGMTQARV